MDNYLTETSRNKIRTIKGIKNPNLDFIMDRMLEAYHKPIRAEPETVHNVRSKFIDFNRKFNDVANAKIESDIRTMDSIYSFTMLDHGINVNILTSQNNNKIVSAIIHALNTFCCMIKYKYHGLTLDICLDPNKRDLIIPKNGENIFEYLKKHSLAFNVSGFTNRSQKYILLTRSEEIIKLLYHELIHYVGLDHLLLGARCEIDLNIRDDLNPSEAYTETLSILFNTAYQAIHLTSKMTNNVYELFGTLISMEIEYSVKLSCKILEFYGYDQDNLEYFFRKGNEKYSPIPIWEYVILRTSLLLNLDILIPIIKTNFYITPNNLDAVLDLMKIDSNTINLFKKYFCKELYSNVSYSLIHLDWNLF